VIAVDDDYYTVQYDADGDCEDYTESELHRLVQWRAVCTGRRLNIRSQNSSNSSHWNKARVVQYRPGKRKAFRVQFEDDRDDDDKQQNLSLRKEEFELLDHEEDDDDDDEKSNNRSAGQQVEPQSVNHDDNQSKPCAHQKSDDNPGPSDNDAAGDEAAAPLEIDIGEWSDVCVGDRVEVWWASQQRYFLGTVIKECAKPEKQFLVEYDDGEKEWLDFDVEQFRIVPATTKRKSTVDRESSKKRKTTKKSSGKSSGSSDDEVLDTEPAPVARLEEDNAGQAALFVGRVGPAAVAPKEPTETVIPKAVPLPAPTRDEECPLCHATTMTRPRALPCHHLFCQDCVEKHLESERCCPLCPCSTKTIELLDEFSSPDSFRQVESIDRCTGEVQTIFSSASAASMMDGRSAKNIILACHSKRRDERAHRGFCWRFHGSKDRILRVGEGVKDGIAVEQICLETGKVLAAFPSSRKATEKTGISRSTIRRVLDQRGVANGGGFFWRFQGETHGPWKDPTPSNTKAVEQLDLESGAVVAEFKSLSDAKKAFGVRPNSGCIRDTCDGNRVSAYGFFWRWKGSSEKPRLHNHGKRVLARRKKHGAVVREYWNARLAADAIGVDVGALCRWCRDEHKARGFYWSYAPETKSTPDENAELVSKRIRVLRPEMNQWMEGKIVSYDPTTEKHTIQYDDGSSVLVCLEDVEHEVKCDQGQKPVEKLNLETGEVLKTFASVSEAGLEVGLNPENFSSISAVLHDQSRHCRGFFYRYQGSEALPRNLKTNRVVEQVCLKSGRVIAVHKSITAAGKAVGITTPGTLILEDLRKT